MRHQEDIHKKQEHHVPHKEKGAGMVEYAMLVALVGVSLIGALNFLRVGINDVFLSAENELTTGGVGS